MPMSSDRLGGGVELREGTVGIHGALKKVKARTSEWKRISEERQRKGGKPPPMYSFSLWIKECRKAKLFTTREMKDHGGGISY